MRGPDQETFDGDVLRIRRKYRAGDKLEDPTKEYVDLFWRSREPVEVKRSPGREISLVGFIGLSAVDRYAWDAVNRVAQEYLVTGRVPPDPLAQWVADLLADQTVKEKERKLRRRPATGLRRRVRDWKVCFAVEHLAARGYPVRRREGRAEAYAGGGTACDVVGKAFSMSYKNVERIWDERIREFSLPENPKRPP